MMRGAFSHLRKAAGFTLVEMIVVIVLTGIVAGMVAVFIRSPVQAYVDTANRARLTEAADTAMRFFARDLRSALPNSLRVTRVGTTDYLEFIPTVGGGRYRQYPTNGGGGDILDFSALDGAFDVIGPVPVYNNTNSVVVFNTDTAAGSTTNAYIGNNRAAVGSANNNAAAISTDAARHTVTIAATRFPAPSPSQRFHMVGPPVTYECNPTAGVLRRYSYGFGGAGGQATPPAGVPNVLVNNVTACTIAYNPAVNTMRTGVVLISLTLTLNGENVNLVHQVHVQNMP